MRLSDFASECANVFLQFPHASIHEGMGKHLAFTVTLAHLGAIREKPDLWQGLRYCVAAHVKNRGDEFIAKFGFV
jgi:hypothetical protein